MARAGKQSPKQADALPLFPTASADTPRGRVGSAPATVVPLPRRKSSTPEDLAVRAMANQPTGASGKRLKLTMTIYLTRAQAEKLTAQAIRSNKNLAALCSEILEKA